LRTGWWSRRWCRKSGHARIPPWWRTVTRKTIENEGKKMKVWSKKSM
jgi:hypothetical protein